MDSLLQLMTISELRNEILKWNISGYHRGLKKFELINLILKYKQYYKHINDDYIPKPPKRIFKNGKWICIKPPESDDDILNKMYTQYDIFHCKLENCNFNEIEKIQDNMNSTKNLIFELEMKILNKKQEIEKKKKNKIISKYKKLINQFIVDPSDDLLDAIDEDYHLVDNLSTKLKNQLESSIYIYENLT